MSMFRIKPLLGLCGGLLLSFGLAGCNDGGGSSTGGGTPTTSTVSGVAMAGPFASGQVCAYQVTAAGAQGTQLACANIDPSDSSFSLSVQDYAGAVVLSLLSGAVYDDEATPGVDTTTLTAPLRSLVTVDGNQVNVAITPLTEAAIRLAGSLNAAAIQTAAQQLAAAYGLTGNGFNLLSTLPRATVTDTLQEAYRQALGFMSGLQSGSGLSLDAYIGNLINTDPTGYAQQVQTYINTHLPAHCTFNAAALVCTMPGSGGGGGGGGSGGGATGNYRLQVSITTSLGTPVPAVTIENIPKPNTQAEFCANEQVIDQIEAVNAGNIGATLAITGCSFSGNSGSINAVVNITNPIVMSISYTALYNYTPM